jgi:hypothetical protein
MSVILLQLLSELRVIELYRGTSLHHVFESTELIGVSTTSCAEVSSWRRLVFGVRLSA